MVNAMVRRCRKQVFKQRRKFPDVFRVHPKLEEDRHLVGHKEDDWMKSHEGNGQKKDNFQVLHPAQPERDAQVVVFPGMMRHVCGPPKSLAVRNVVRPVAEEVEQDVAGNERPPIQFHSPGHQVVDPDGHVEQQDLDPGADHNIAETQTQGSQRFYLVIIFFVLPVGDEYLQAHENEHYGRSPENDFRSALLQGFHAVPGNFVGTKNKK